MGDDGVWQTDPTARTAVTLSTGETIDLPLSAEATMLGAAFSAPRRPVERLLPDGIRPLRATPTGKAAVTLLGVEYRRVGAGEIDPYDEFAVIVPAAPEPTGAVPYLSALTRATSGYVWFMPVTTEPAKALGVDVWGFPKIVADVVHEDEGSRRRTTVRVDGERFVALEVERPPAVYTRDDGYAYADGDDTLSRVPTEVNGRIGGWPLSGEVSVSFGPHERAAPLRDLGLGGRALARLSVEGEALFYPGEPVSR